MNNIICICGNAVDKEIEFCDSCGLGLPEIERELKELKGEIPIINVDDVYIEKISARIKNQQIVRLSELF